MTTAEWTNWLGNHTAAPRSLAAPADAGEVARLVGEAVAEELSVRVAGAGHSAPPLVPTDGLLLDLRNLSGVVAVDRERGEATVGAGTSLRELGPLLAAHGVALPNQGDIDPQSIAGAIATGTHGSGARYPGIAAGVRGMRVVGADGAVAEIEPELLDAARVSLGLLGVVVEVTVAVVDAFWLKERSWVCSLDEALERWDELISRHRHCSLFWLPAPESPELFGIDAWGLSAGAGACVVRTFDEVPREQALPAEPRPGRRRGPGYEVFPYVYDRCVESELFVALQDGPAAVRAVVEAFEADRSLTRHPVLVRTIRGDGAWLSPSHGRDSVAISVCGDPAAAERWPALDALDAALDPFASRPHWGKLHSFDRDRLHERLPRLGDFLDLRARLDPAGAFLNPYLRELLLG